MRHYRSHKRTNTTLKELPICQIHKNAFEYLCSVDNILTCASCHAVGDHIGHKAEPISDVANKTRSQLELSLLEMQEMECTTLAASDMLSATISEVVSGTSRHVTSLESLIDTLITSLQRRKAEIYQQVILAQSNKMEQLITLRNELANLLETLHHAEKHCSNQLTETDDLSLLQTHQLSEPVDLIAMRTTVEASLPKNMETSVNLVFSSETMLREMIESFGRVGGPPAPIWLPVSNVTGKSVLLHWEPVIGAARYHVQRQSESGEFVDVYTGSDVACRCAGLSAMTSYQLRLRSQCVNGGLGEWGVMMSIATAEARAINLFASLTLDNELRAPDLLLDRKAMGALMGNADKWGSVLGDVGITLTDGSGEIGYFETRNVCYTDDGRAFTYIGLAAREFQVSVDALGCGCAGEGWGWYGYNGGLFSKIPGLPATEGDLDMIYKKSDVVGLLISCEREPFLALFVNKKEVYRYQLGVEAFGKTLFPAISLHPSTGAELIENNELPSFYNSLETFL